MVSKSQIKLIRSLAQKKYRLKNQLFSVEGKKSVVEFLRAGFKLRNLYVSEDFEEFFNYSPEIVSETDLKKISQLKTPAGVLAIFEIPESRPIKPSGIMLALDEIRDPGNLGTIIRLCDWFGINEIICSESCVDCYNPKVVQASMGSLGRVNINYLNLEKFLKDLPAEVPVLGTFMEGDNIYRQKLPAEAVLVMGNEANGISEEIKKLITQKISIPRFGEFQQTESLNVATATAICLSELRRNT